MLWLDVLMMGSYESDHDRMNEHNSFNIKMYTITKQCNDNKIMYTFSPLRILLQNHEIMLVPISRQTAVINCAW